MRTPIAALAALLMISVASPAAAQLRLAWNDCLPPAGAGYVTQTFACNTNSATFRIYGSVIAPSGTTAVTGEQAQLDLQSDGAVLPAWWQFLQTGSCRSGGSLSINYITPPASGCMTDYFGSIGLGPSGGFGYTWGASAGLLDNHARIKTVSAVDYTLAGPMTAGAETYLFTIVLKTTNTVGTGVCAGCETPVAILFSYMLLAQPAGVGDIWVSPSDVPYVSWQCPATVTSHGLDCMAGAQDCIAWADFSFPCATPAPTRTWGQVKALYR